MPEGSSQTAPGDDRAQGPDRSSIVVVGAGAAGLAAARALAVQGKDANCRISVLEASGRVGGRLFCEEIDGFQVYSGASVIHESFASTRNLAHELGVPLSKGPEQKGGQVYAGDRFWSMFVGGSLKQSLTTLYTMFFSPQHTLAGSLEFMRMFALLKKHAGAFDFEDHTSLLDMDGDESFAEFAGRNSFRRYLEQAEELDLNCFTAGSSEQVGAAYGMALLWLWTFDPASRSHLPRQGIGAFAKALVDSCTGLVRVSTPVERIILEEGKASGVVTTGGEWIDADAVICATTASSAARIIPELQAGMTAALERVSYGSCCNIAFGLDANILAEGSHAGLFPPGSPTFLTMVTNLAAMAPDATPPGKTMIHVSVIGEHARALFALEDDEIIRRVLEEMRRFFPAMPEHPRFARVYRWPEALCLSPAGMLREIHDMRVQMPQSTPGLFLAGDYTRLPSLNGAIKSGLEAAEASLSYVGAIPA